jgi:hypothetical protein
MTRPSLPTYPLPMIHPFKKFWIRLMNGEGGHFLSMGLPLPLGQFGQQPAGDRLADAHLFLHVPDAGSHRMDHRNFEVVLHRDDIDDAPGARAEQVNPLGRWWYR